mmetsp:Transcript_2869/g.359  ORF Transcript_2869/g.359 Transcript_2869/m.359 type:complete len:90 (+) Transcript_2869:158-427(+)
MILAIILMSICLLFEILVLFTGKTLFYDRVNIINCIIHSLGVILLCWLMFDDWKQSYIWAIWFFTSLIPSVVDLLIFLRSRTLYKARFN